MSKNNVVNIYYCNHISNLTKSSNELVDSQVIDLYSEPIFLLLFAVLYNSNISSAKSGIEPVSDIQDIRIPLFKKYLYR